MSKREERRVAVAGGKSQALVEEREVGRGIVGEMSKVRARVERCDALIPSKSVT